jgi:negative regulator of sigma E activity
MYVDTEIILIEHMPMMNTAKALQKNTELRYMQTKYRTIRRVPEMNRR